MIGPLIAIAFLACVAIALSLAWAASERDDIRIAPPEPILRATPREQREPR